MRQFSLLSRYIQINSWLEWVALATMLLITFFAFGFYDATDPRRWFVVALFALIILLDLWSAAPTARPIGRAYNEQQVESVRLALMTGATLGLITLDVNFTALIILYFIFSARALLIFPNGVGYGWVLLFGTITTVFITLLTWPIWQYGLLNGLGATCGYFFMGSAANAQRRAELASAESQRLLGELQSAHHQLQAYANQVEALAVAEERNRLAREMHDTLGHRLTVAAVQLEGAQKLINRDPDRAALMVSTVRAQVLDGLHELRETVAALRAPLAEDLPLRTSLTQLVTNFTAATPIQVALTLPERLPDLAPAQRQAFYRAAQESLTNIQRHAQAGQVTMTLAVADLPGTGVALAHPVLQLSVADDGIGLNHGPAPGFGLQGLAERAAALGGHFAVAAGCDLGGVVLTFALPLAPTELLCPAISGEKEHADGQ